MKKAIKKIIKIITPNIILNKLLYYRGEKNLKKNFYKVHGYELNLKDPKTFSEKIQYRKFYGNNEFMAKIADKYLVRNYVKEKIGEDYLIPLLGVYDKIKVSDLEKLPNEFVIKTNHGSGANHIEIVKDKTKIDLNKLCKKMNKAVKEKFGYASNELFYTLMEPKIIVENLLLKNNKIPEDYKFHYFGDDNIYIEVITKTEVHKYYNFYDVNWNKIDFNPKKINDLEIKKPENFEKAKEIVRKLGEEFDYVRVDLYIIEDKIYFGELTQTHGAGFSETLSKEWDIKFGNMWNMNLKNTKLYR